MQNAVVNRIFDGYSHSTLRLMPTTFYQTLFWLYWAITLGFAGLLLAIFIREKERDTKMISVMLLVPVALRLLLIK